MLDIKMEWDKIAEKLLEEEEKRKKYLYPPATSISFEWKGDLYPGTLHELEGEECEGIVMLSKPTKPVPKELMDAVSRLQPDRTLFIADEELDLDGAVHMLAREGNRLIRMSPEQTLVASQLKIDINQI